MAIHLVRHGETAWSASGKHTSSSDIPMTEEGLAQAAALPALLAGIEPVAVRSSPRRRALETCRLAGLADRVAVDDRLVEWDYGAAEGRTTAELREEVPGWTVWTHDPEGGESLEQVGARADAVVADLRTIEGDVVLFGHAHFFRVLGARWCGLPAAAGRNLLLAPASVSTLGWERESPALARWNVTAGTVAP